jgi:glycerol-3-phosphate dehydrogenase
VAAQRGAQGWTATLRSRSGQERTLGARALVNAAGPWAESFLRGETRSAHGEALATRSLRLIKGSHIVVPRCFEHDHAYIFQNPDKRIIFAIPYEERFTLIGTTDVELVGDPRDARVDDDEVAYLCAQASRYFTRPIDPSEVVWRYAGVRPLLDDASDDPAAVTRDYLLESNTEAAPLLSVWGGKITTFRKLAEEAADEIGRMLGESRAAWTKRASLPGGDFTAWIGRPVSPDTDFERFVLAVRSRYPWLDAALARRLARAYGSRVERVLEGAGSRPDLGDEVAPGMFEIELRYLRREEWACTAEDVLWRRTKRGLHLSEGERERVADWMHRADEHRKVA